MCNFAKRVLTVYQRATSAIWVNHKKYQILLMLWLLEWQIVLIWVQFNSLRWKTCIFLKAFRMANHVIFSDFSGILLFENFLKGPIQYLLIQSQQWKHQKKVPSMFKVNNKETKRTLMTLFWCFYCC